jgi:hypothetical protein
VAAQRPLLIAMCALMMVTMQAANAQTAQEQVKATFIYRFASFVSWPSSSFADATSPVRVCVIGADPLVRTLQRITTDQRSGARAFEVRRLNNPSDIGACHVVYVVGDRTEATLREARRRPIVTITDSVSGGDRGVIHFTLVDDRVRFYVDDAVASESGLAVDPRLLNLALAVRRRPGS